ncbi:hypothetical protein, partial [Bacteroides caccae]|uniref:hypothetical protein n=1 Tax=Bacteroides caccae TaxID=47678 RepID=UPI0034A1252D
DRETNGVAHIQYAYCGLHRFCSIPYYNMSAEYQLLLPHYSFTQVKLVSPLVSRNVLPVTFSFFHQKSADG